MSTVTFSISVVYVKLVPVALRGSKYSSATVGGAKAAKRATARDARARGFATGKGGPMMGNF